MQRVGVLVQAPACAPSLSPAEEASHARDLEPRVVVLQGGGRALRIDGHIPHTLVAESPPSLPIPPAGASHTGRGRSRAWRHQATGASYSKGATRKARPNSALRLQSEREKHTGEENLRGVVGPRDEGALRPRLGATRVEVDASAGDVPHLGELRTGHGMVRQPTREPSDSTHAGMSCESLEPSFGPSVVTIVSW